MTEKYKRHPDIKADILPDGYVLLQMPKTDWVYTLTPLGGIVWEFCDGNNALDDIFRQITELEHVKSTADLKQQIADLLQEFQKSGLFTSEGC